MPGRAAPHADAPTFKLIAPRPLCGALGAAIAGVDLSQPLSDALFAEIEAAFHEHVVLVFPDQHWTPAQQVAFTARFGPVEEHPLRSRAGLPEQPEVLVLVNKPGTRGARNDIWHSDISFSETPPLGSVLYALQVPEGYGDTMFCNMARAYAQLSPALRELLRPLTALHSAAGLAARNNAGDNNASPITSVPAPAEHPVVRTHPGNGRLALYVNPWFTERFSGMTAEESRPLLDFLAVHATRPENVYRHRWRQHDVVMWDNRAAMHYAVRDYDESQVRIMHRTTALGDRPV
jgi:taurine dioxygenase